MSYSTPHHAHEFMKAACLAIVHQFVLTCQRHSIASKHDLLLRKREIDFNSRLGMFFGPEASLSAQGVSDSDLLISSPVLEVELKYCRPKQSLAQPVNHWNQVIDKDWRWLLGLNNAGDTFKKSAWVVVFPSIELFTFHQCFQVPQNKLVNGQIDRSTYAPFVEIVRPVAGNITHLEYQPVAWHRDAILQRGGVGAPVRIRRQIVGNKANPIWALIFSRIGNHANQTLQHLPVHTF